LVSGWQPSCTPASAPSGLPAAWRWASTGWSSSWPKTPLREAELYPDLIAAIGQIQPDVKSLDLASLLDTRFAQDALKRGLTG